MTTIILTIGIDDRPVFEVRDADGRPMARFAQRRHAEEWQAKRGRPVVRDEPSIDLSDLAERPKKGRGR